MSNIEHVKIRHRGMYWDIAADIYFPPNFDDSKKYPTIVVAHPIGSCKEQTSGEIYSAQLAEQGFVTLAFDASFQGESGGEPRSTEDPTLRVEDFRHVADYLVTLPYVDAERIGLIGMCGGGGYAINAVMTERRYKAVATITGANYGRVLREAEGSVHAVIAKLEQIGAQRTAEARGEDYLVDPGLPSSLEEAAEWGITDVDILGATEYYKTDRGAKPNGVNLTLRSRQSVAYGWDAFHLAEELLTQPLMVIVGDIPGGFGAYRDGHEIIRRARSEKKELVVIKDWSHYDLYDKDEPVAQAMAKLTPFFTNNL
ncbi:alpha/beta hydrolase [Glutamicibacter halophytocola]|uniref:alpha/beta hydrolase n=1 Tax=Glutamicibacter halophytocola TaxID=1933880 RepID=UPI000AC9C8FE|nr:alpha/beta hydrolase [Glutamicibacter halophytocola]